MPFLEISHSAKIGTVVGSIDLGRLVNPTEPEAALLPGTIPQAHRGIIFVDEINRLAETSPELADVLLDVMGTKPGRVQIEETGLPAVELTVQVSVWAASNPDEDPGPLEEVRRQLSDRFDFVLYTDRPRGADVVEQILALAEAGGAQPAEADVEMLRARLGMRAAELHRLKLPPGLRQQIADLYSRFDLESLRAVQAIQTGVRLAACLAERGEPNPEDLRCVVPMALRHRVDPETLRKVLASLTAAPQPEEAAPAARTRFPGLSFGGIVAEAARPQPVEDRLARPGDFPRGDDPASPTRPDGGAGPAGRGASARGAAGQGGSGPMRAGQGGYGRGGSGPDAPGQGASGMTSSAAASRGAGGPGVPGPGAAAGAGQAPAGGGRSWLRSALERLGLARPGSAMHLPNPAEQPAVAPPHRARPLHALPPDDWVRGEEELRRR